MTSKNIYLILFRELLHSFLDYKHAYTMHEKSDKSQEYYNIQSRYQAAGVLNFKQIVSVVFSKQKP